MAGRGCKVEAYKSMMKKAAGGKVQTSADTARKLATEMGGMKQGGAQIRFDLSKVGANAPRPAPRAPARSRAVDDTLDLGKAVARGNREPYEKIPRRKKGGKMDGGFVRDAVASKLAQGGAAKVRKGMMTQSGSIIKAVKPKKGIGGIM